jgi:hypothetical protein
MSKAEFSWIKDLISTDEKALGVYLAVLHLRFVYHSTDFTSISHFMQIISRYSAPFLEQIWNLSFLKEDYMEKILILLVKPLRLS